MGNGKKYQGHNSNRVAHMLLCLVHCHIPPAPPQQRNSLKQKRTPDMTRFNFSENLKQLKPCLKTINKKKNKNYFVPCQREERRRFLHHPWGSAYLWSATQNRHQHSTQQTLWAASQSKLGLHLLCAMVLGEPV